MFCRINIIQKDKYIDKTLDKFRVILLAEQIDKRNILVTLLGNLPKLFLIGSTPQPKYYDNLLTDKFKINFLEHKLKH